MKRQNATSEGSSLQQTEPLHQVNSQEAATQTGEESLRFVVYCPPSTAFPTNAPEAQRRVQQLRRPSHGTLNLPQDRMHRLEMGLADLQLTTQNLSGQVEAIHQGLAAIFDRKRYSKRGRIGHKIVRHDLSKLMQHCPFSHTTIPEDPFIHWQPSASVRADR